VRVSSDPTEVARADKLVLPGVGAFADARAELDRRGLARPVVDHIRGGRKFLGICLGLQLLFDRSTEDGEHEGLGVIRGGVIRFRTRELKVPHIGWNTLEMTPGVGLFDGVPPHSTVYFVHSYYVVPCDDTVVAARTEYGETFTSAVATENVWATQFHPEKSQRVGLRMLENFVKW
ncbi:MAG TPA: imidazole glycerol phosphate synthase subunit HisH, partial [Planctomycetota bacterium]|nr:imidazole glycerol phosphate synthase subunit HisH [Planctomycetota bacterium]